MMHKSAVLKLLTNAPANRRWRRLALIPMCVARHNRDFVPMNPVEVSDNDSWSDLAAWLLEMVSGGGTNGIFRTILWRVCSIYL